MTESVFVYQGWSQQATGPYYDAWRSFWEKDFTRLNISPHKAWTRALGLTTQRGSREWRAHMLAQVLLNPGGDDVSLRSCACVDTPWNEELPDTCGKIAIREDFERVYRQLTTNPNERHRDGVLVQGQAGVGKTYLAYYLLIRRLSEGKEVIFSPYQDAFYLFNGVGVFFADDLPCDENGYPAFGAIAPDKTWMIIYTAPDGAEPPPSAVDPVFFTVQLCQPHTKYYSNWYQRSAVDYLAVDAPSASSLLAEALIHKNIRPRKDDLARVLEHIHAFGTRPGLCLWNIPASAFKSKIWSLEDYIKSLDLATLEHICRLSLGDWHFWKSIRLSDEPDLLMLRRNPAVDPEALVAVLPSRHVATQLRRYWSFDMLQSLTRMEVMQAPPNYLAASKSWLFEQLCHHILTVGDTALLDRHSLRLTELEPTESESNAKAGVLRIDHFSPRRMVQSFDADPPAFDPDIYCVPDLLLDGSYHAIMYSYPFAPPKTSMPEDAAGGSTTRQPDKPDSGRVGGGTVSGRKTRLPKRAGKHSRDSPSPLKKPRLEAEKRSVVFLQMMLHHVPEMTKNGLHRLECIMEADPSTEHSMVFVTLKDAGVDLSAIPNQWLNKLKWYQLEINLPFRRV